MLEKENQITLSICIPTFNRAHLLRGCLEAITIQFKDEEVFKRTEIVISDNASPDNTGEVAREFMEKFPNIKYVRNSENTGNKNTISVISHANGEFIWIFADDDLHKDGSLRYVLDCIDRDKPDVIYCNLDMVSEKRKTVAPNILGLGRDYLFRSKKEFFQFLNRKFYFSIDWYTTFLSNYLVRKDFFEKYSYILKKYTSPLHLYPHAFSVYYVNNNPRIKVIAKSLISYRQVDIGWEFSNKVKFEIFRNKLLTEHYKNIIRVNKKILPITFAVNVQIKKMMRLARIILCWSRII